jgi:phosphoglycerate dehydrogenase-like enzyme
VIDEASLAVALQSGKIAAAGLDVFEKEPLTAGRLFPGIPNLVLTDHSAYYSVESVSALKTRAALNALEALEGRIPRTPVNRPLNLRKSAGREITA